jgi:hypothetical protein
MKFFSHGWVLYEKRGKRNPKIVRYFPGLADTRDGLAQDIIIMKDVEVDEEYREVALANPAQYLESLGYVWEELPGSLQSFA